jgi:hypothetical protein
LVSILAQIHSVVPTSFHDKSAAGVQIAKFGNPTITHPT